MEGTNYIGYFSWKFPYKTGLSKDMVYHFIKNEDVDVISFCHPLDKPYLEFTESHHPGFMALFTRLCVRLGLEVKEPKCLIYSNFFVAKPHIYREYINECVLPALKILEEEEFKDVWNNSSYRGLGPNLKQTTGLDYYPFHIFLIERLISIWIDNKGLSWKVKTKI
jgi:hypothetical protein